MKDKLKVLLLENSPEDAFLIQRELKSAATVDVAINGQMFRAMLSEKWDCILCDLSLPDIDGREAIRLVKATNKKTPVIVITGSVSARQADAACEAGAVRYFMKTEVLVKDDRYRPELALARAVRDAHEKALLEAQSIRDNRLQIVGETFTGYMHDINNLLQIFASGPDLLLKRLANVLSESDRRILDLMASTAKRGGEMSKQISMFVRGSNGGSMKSVATEFLLTELGAFMRDSFPKNIVQRTLTAAGTSSIKCDSTEIHQLLLNLCINARDAMPNGGELHVTAQNASFTAGPLQGDFVCICVRDTGAGIPDDVLPRIFEQFFTTKPIGKGTGMGLPMAKRIAQDHGGDIDVKTGTAGTAFFVYLPVAVAETHAESVHRAEEFDGQGQQLLFVDDEAGIRTFVNMILEDANYKPLLAENGMEALSYFRSNRIAALVTDLWMPLMNGLELAAALRGQRFNLPIVFLTGDADADQAAFDPAPNEILKKPFSPEKLLSCLKRVLPPDPKLTPKQS